MEKTEKEITKIELTSEEANVLFFAVCDRILALDKDVAVLSDEDGDYYVSRREAVIKEMDSLNLLSVKIGQLL
jgi:hypothetical protein